MATTVAEWLAAFGTQALVWSAAAFVLVNGAAAIALWVTRDRSLVNRWTPPLLAANMILAGTGLGIPLATAMARLALMTLAPAAQSAIPAERDAAAASQRPASTREAMRR